MHETHTQDQARTLTAIRVARPSLDLDRACRFYEHTVGLPVLGSFSGHDGFDGVIFGVPDAKAQLEIVRSPHDDIPAPTAEDAIVLYCTDIAAADQFLTRLRQAAALEVTDQPTTNPFWPRNGARVFVDPDGYRLVIAPATAGVHDSGAQNTSEVSSGTLASGSETPN